MADLTFNALLYPDHPMAAVSKAIRTPCQGWAVTTRQLLSALLLSQGMIIVLVGAVQAGAALDKVQAALGDWRTPGVTPIRMGIASPAP